MPTRRAASLRSHRPGREPVPADFLPYPKNTPVIASDFAAGSPEAEANRQYHEQLIQELRAKLERVRQGGSEQSLKLHKSRGKLFVRDRIEHLLDPAGSW